MTRVFRLAAQFHASVTRHLGERDAFQSFGDWLLSIVDVSLRFVNHNFFTLKAGIWKLNIRDCEQPLHFRLGSSDGTVIEEIFIDRVYGPVCASLANARLVVDAGANAGYSLLFWRKHLPEANIIAIEPDSGNCRMINLNCDVDGQSKEIVLVQACLAAESGWVYLDRSGDECAFRMVRNSVAGSERIAAKTLPEIVNEFSEGQVIDLLKCDIEGAEVEVFRECSGWLNQIRNIVIEIHPPYTIEDFTADISRNGGQFDVSAIGPSDRADLFMAQNRSQTGCRIQ